MGLAKREIASAGVPTHQSEFGASPEYRIPIGAVWCREVMGVVLVLGTGV